VRLTPTQLRDSRQRALAFGSRNHGEFHKRAEKLWADRIIFCLIIEVTFRP
jgi:hypothetical protein